MSRDCLLQEFGGKKVKSQKSKQEVDLLFQEDVLRRGNFRQLPMMCGYCLPCLCQVGHTLRESFQKN
jgi:hypothetical protein